MRSELYFFFFLVMWGEGKQCVSWNKSNLSKALLRVLTVTGTTTRSLMSLHIWGWGRGGSGSCAPGIKKIHVGNVLGEKMLR